MRWLVDRARRSELAHKQLSELQLAAEGDKSPGVLMASGYIAGGAIAGILIAFVQGKLLKLDTSLTQWAEAHNPFYAGMNSDLLALVPFVLLALLLWLVGREKVLAGRRTS